MTSLPSTCPPTHPELKVLAAVSSTTPRLPSATPPPRSSPARPEYVPSGPATTTVTTHNTAAAAVSPGPLGKPRAIAAAAAAAFAASSSFSSRLASPEHRGESRSGTTCLPARALFTSPSGSSSGIVRLGGHITTTTTTTTHSLQLSPPQRPPQSPPPPPPSSFESNPRRVRSVSTTDASYTRSPWSYYPSHMSRAHDLASSVSSKTGSPISSARSTLSRPPSWSEFSLGEDDDTANGFHLDRSDSPAKEGGGGRAFLTTTASFPSGQRPDPVTSMRFTRSHEPEVNLPYSGDEMEGDTRRGRQAHQQQSSPPIASFPPARDSRSPIVQRSTLRSFQLAASGGGGGNSSSSSSSGRRVHSFSSTISPHISEMIMATIGHRRITSPAALRANAKPPSTTAAIKPNPKKHPHSPDTISPQNISQSGLTADSQRSIRPVASRRRLNISGSTPTLTGTSGKEPVRLHYESGDTTETDSDFETSTVQHSPLQRVRTTNPSVQRSPGPMYAYRPTAEPPMARAATDPSNQSISFFNEFPSGQSSSPVAPAPATFSGPGSDYNGGDTTETDEDIQLRFFGRDLISDPEQSPPGTQPPTLNTATIIPTTTTIPAATVTATAPTVVTLSGRRCSSTSLLSVGPTPGTKSVHRNHRNLSYPLSSFNSQENALIAMLESTTPTAVAVSERGDTTDSDASLAEEPTIDPSQSGLKRLKRSRGRRQLRRPPGPIAAASPIVNTQPDLPLPSSGGDAAANTELASDATDSLDEDVRFDPKKLLLLRPSFLTPTLTAPQSPPHELPRLGGLSAETSHLSTPQAQRSSARSHTPLPLATDSPSTATVTPSAAAHGRNLRTRPGSVAPPVSSAHLSTSGSGPPGTHRRHASYNPHLPTEPKREPGTFLATTFETRIRPGGQRRHSTVPLHSGAPNDPHPNRPINPSLGPSNPLSTTHQDTPPRTRLLDDDMASLLRSPDMHLVSPTPFTRHRAKSWFTNRTTGSSSSSSSSTLGLPAFLNLSSQQVAMGGGSGATTELVTRPRSLTTDFITARPTKRLRTPSPTPIFNGAGFPPPGTPLSTARTGIVKKLKGSLSLPPSRPGPELGPSLSPTSSTTRTPSISLTNDVAAEVLASLPGSGSRSRRSTKGLVTPPRLDDVPVKEEQGGSSTDTDEEPPRPVGTPYRQLQAQLAANNDQLPFGSPLPLRFYTVPGDGTLPPLPVPPSPALGSVLATASATTMLSPGRVFIRQSSASSSSSSVIPLLASPQLPPGRGGPRPVAFSEFESSLPYCVRSKIKTKEVVTVPKMATSCTTATAPGTTSKKSTVPASTHNLDNQPQRPSSPPIAQPGDPEYDEDATESETELEIIRLEHLPPSLPPSSGVPGPYHPPPPSFVAATPSRRLNRRKPFAQATTTTSAGAPAVKEGTEVKPESLTGPSPIVGRTHPEEVVSRDSLPPRSHRQLDFARRSPRSGIRSQPTPDIFISTTEDLPTTLLETNGATSRGMGISTPELLLQSSPLLSTAPLPTLTSANPNSTTTTTSSSPSSPSKKPRDELPRSYEGFFKRLETSSLNRLSPRKILAGQRTRLHRKEASVGDGAPTMGQLNNATSSVSYSSSSSLSPTTFDQNAKALASGSGGGDGGSAADTVSYLIGVAASVIVNIIIIKFFTSTIDNHASPRCLHFHSSHHHTSTVQPIG
ncbi:hypothetical protein H4R33_005235 [Dimargaris cristalligena]|nr:hypothetical protein H4R33_005235 [Dimargaris cristalligena]